MANEGDRTHSLKEAVFESLVAILSPMQDVIKSGEDQIKALEVTEEFGVYLAEFIVDPANPLPVRQLASVLLKQYVEVHWSHLSDKFRAPETPEHAKETIRRLVPLGLKESSSKVRSTVAYAISAIAHWDWPEAWPQLFDILMKALTSGNPEVMHGAMRVLTEFCREVTDRQMPMVAPVILPEMFKIFSQPEVFSARMRSRAVDIFNTCANMIAAIGELNKDAPKQLLFPILPQFTEAFVATLKSPSDLMSDSGLRIEVLKALTSLINNYPQFLAQALPSLLPSVWSTLTHSATVYLQSVVNNPDDADAGCVDSDGEVIGFENLIFSMFDFIIALVESGKYRQLVKKGVEHLFYYTVLFLQISEEQAHIWTSNPEQFVEDEDVETFSYTVRIAALDLLQTLEKSFSKESATALCSAVLRHLQEAEQARNAGSPHWWKVEEACLLALGSASQLLLLALDEQRVQLDINVLLQNVVYSRLSLNVSPFLLGRCLWVSGRFAEAMSPELLAKLLEATVSGLHPQQPTPMRISATRASLEFCGHLKSTDSVHLLQPHLAHIIEGLVSIAQQFPTEVLALSLESLCMVLAVDKQVTAQLETRVSPLALAVFLKFNSDPMLVSLAQDVFQVLVQNEACAVSVLTRLIPTTVSIINAPVERVTGGLQAAAIDMLQTVVRSCVQPLPDALIVTAFPATVQCTLISEDNGTLQSGGECLRAYVCRALPQLCQWRDTQGNSGVHYIVQVILKLLDPKTSEFTATFVGRLVSALISRLGLQLGEDLDLILRAVLSKMQQATTLSVIQSLVLVFAHLMHTQLDAVLDFLTNVPGPMGKPALEFVLTEWCSKQHLFYGSFEGKVSAIALCHLLRHTIETNDVRMQTIDVKGDQIIRPDEGVRTRSKAAQVQDEWTVIPVVVKIYKLLINELSNQLEADGVDDQSDEEDTDSETGSTGGADDDDDGVGDMDDGDNVLSSHTGYDEVEDEADVDDMNDPAYKVDLKMFVTDFLVSLSHQSCYPMFSQHHTDNERKVLQTIGINNA